MDHVVHRIRSLDGMTSTLLVQLAKKSPTYLQIELLTSVQEVQQFVENDKGLSHLCTLDDDTLARYASLEPTTEQMKILCTAESVRQFIQSKENVSGTCNPVGALQEKVTPVVPLYTCSIEENGDFSRLCSVGSRHTTGRGSKRIAKSESASAMLDYLHCNPVATQIAASHGCQCPRGDRDVSAAEGR